MRNPQEHAEWLEKCSLEELMNQVVWEAVMEGTAHCGWTNRARDGLFKSVMDSVNFALTKKLNPSKE